MTILIDTVIRRTLDALLEELSNTKPDRPLEAWVFEDAAARRAAEARLAAASVTARIRSAYKPLLCFFLEEVDRAALREATIRYPRHPRAHPGGSWPRPIPWPPCSTVWPSPSSRARRHSLMRSC